MDEEKTTPQGDDWDDIDLSDVVDDDPEEEGAGQEDAGTPTESEGKAEPAKDKGDQFELTFLGEKKTYGRDEITQLAQKGLNYDHLQERLTAAEEKAKTADDGAAALALVQQLAKANNQTAEEFIATARASQYAEQHGVSNEEAKRLLELEAREKSIAQKEAAQTAEAKRREEFLNFAKAHPDVQPDKIPQEVWESVRGGASLDAAYTQYENKQLRAQLEALKQAETNKKRSAGSASSSGKSELDEFDSLWYDGT